MALPGMRIFYHFRNKHKRWFWVLVGGNGRIMARSRKEGYTTEAAVLNAIQNLQDNAPTARVIRGTNKLNAP